MRQCRALVNTVPHKPPHMVWKQQVSLVPCMRVCAQSCWTLWDIMDCSLPGPSVYALPQNRCSSRTSLAWPAAKYRSPGSPVYHTTVCYKSLTGSRYSVKIVKGRNRRRQGRENTHFQIFLTPHPHYQLTSGTTTPPHLDAHPMSHPYPDSRFRGPRAQSCPSPPWRTTVLQSAPKPPSGFLHCWPRPSTGERATKTLVPP